MSRFANPARLAALGLLASTTVAGPAFADAMPYQPTGSCAPTSGRVVPSCRNARHHTILRTAMVEPRGFGDYAVTGRSLNLLILGVGF